MALVFLRNHGGWLGDTGPPPFSLLVMLLPHVLVSCPLFFSHHILPPFLKDGRLRVPHLISQT